MQRGRLPNIVDALGTTSYSYSQVGQLLSEDGPWTDDTVSFACANRLRTSLGILDQAATAWSQSYSVSLRQGRVSAAAGGWVEFRRG